MTLKERLSEECLPIIDVTGFGIPYDNAILRMADAGRKYLLDNQEQLELFEKIVNCEDRTYIIAEWRENLSAYDISKHMPALDEAMVAEEPDCTGNMFDTAMNFLMYSIKNSWKELIKEMVHKQ